MHPRLKQRRLKIIQRRMAVQMSELRVLLIRLRSELNRLIATPEGERYACFDEECLSLLKILERQEYSVHEAVQVVLRIATYSHGLAMTLRASIDNERDPLISKDVRR
jgi:hypothetical protein